MKHDAVPTIFFGTSRAVELPHHDEWMGPGEIFAFQRLKTEPRRQSFRLGRWTAKHILSRVLSIPFSQSLSTRIEVLSNTDGVPIPYLDGESLPHTLSLSHREDRALAAASPASLSMGCDLEWIEPHSRAFVEDFFTPEERENTFCSSSPHLMATLIWSAKESALKALRTGLSRDTRELCVQLSGPFSEHSSSWHALSVIDRTHEKTLRGLFRIDQGYILTIVADSDIPTPFLLES